MYEYTWYQWLTFFYLYCLFGWIFESTYVSLKKGRFVNRGFLRLPMLPLYGTGAIMMLWISLPVKDNLLMVFLFGMIGATVLEYVTGSVMERLFKVKYWDYSNQILNLNGYICISSSIAWGFLTILMTEVIHPPIEDFVLNLNLSVELGVLAVVSVLFVNDCIRSVKEALDLAKVLESLTNMRSELDNLQVQIALLKAETSQKMAVMKKEQLERLNVLKEVPVARAAEFKKGTSRRLSSLLNYSRTRMPSRPDLTTLIQRMNAVSESRKKLTGHINFYHKSILRGNPNASSTRFADALRELREAAEKRKDA